MQTIYQPFKGQINRMVLEKRIKFFKKVLVYLTKEQHEKFLKEHNYPIFDPVKTKTWHHLFDLNEVKDIENCKIIENNTNERKKIIF